MPATIEQRLERILEFVRAMTAPQFTWVCELQTAEFSTTEPEKSAYALIYTGLFAGIRSNSAMYLVEDALSTRGISFNTNLLNKQRFAAKEQYDKVGAQPLPPPPPLIISAGPKQ